MTLAARHAAIAANNTKLFERFEAKTSGTIGSTDTIFEGGSGGTREFAAAPSGRSGYVAKLSTSGSQNVNLNLGNNLTGGSPITSGVVTASVWWRCSGSMANYSNPLGLVDEQSGFLFNSWQKRTTDLALRLTSLTTNSGADYQCTADTWYRLWIRADYTNKTVAGRIYAADGSLLASQSTSWTTVSRTNPNGQLNRVYLYNVSSATNSAYFDDFKVWR